MEKNRSSKIIAVIALVVAVAGLTLGFAAFSTTLTISSSAYVNPSDENFKVGFSTTTTAGETGQLDASEGNGGTATVTEKKISGIKANFTAPGESVTYKLYVHNTGEYDAYLNGSTFANVAGENAPKICAAADGSNATAKYVSAACEDISISVQITDGVDINTELTGSTDSIGSHLLPKKGNYHTVNVTISYAENGDRADGAFNVSFGDISLDFGTQDLNN